MLIAFLAAVGIDGLKQGATSSHGMHTIAPEKVMSTEPFAKPGVYRTRGGQYEAIVVAYAFGFLPKEDLVVPAGKPIHFRVASLDVVHGYTIPGRTNVNLEVLPGHISEITQTFDHPGRYLVLCNEYCGSGHHFMTAHIRVLKPGENLQHPPPLDGSPDTNENDGMAAMDSMKGNS
ncbi:MAG: cytochrome c oxidase subunit II [Thermoleophilia bacterium]|nr:cytochrome c oxidase subunit II [Thermoleophilia bacterium]